MSTVEAIKQAIQKLPTSDLARFRRWFAAFDGDAWNNQIQKYAAAGTLDALAAEALAEARKSTETPEKVEALVHQSIAHIALIVRDYDEALDFYVGKLRFRVVEDTDQPEQEKRWVVISPPGSSGASLLLARASTPEQEAFIGNQSGGRVFLFLQTDDFWRDYRRMISAGVRFARPPSEAAYGTVAVFEDPYGDRWDLLQYNKGAPVETTS